MLNTIGESVVRTTTRADHNLAVENKDVTREKTEKILEERPVEDTEASAKAETGKDNKAGGYKSDDKGVFYEKYDKKGNVVYRLPPEQKPIDELA
jgi:hypothetical protein